MDLSFTIKTSYLGDKLLLFYDENLIISNTESNEVNLRS